MIYRFRAVIHLIIEVSDADFKIIWENCKHHYDATIRSLVEVGGFIYGYRNRRDFTDEEDKEMELTEHQLDYIMKSIENDFSDEAAKLKDLFHGIVREMHDTYYDINNKLEPK